MEEAPIIHCILIDHHTSTGCLRRRPFQVRCDDRGCIECLGVFLDLTYVWSIYYSPLLARSIIGLLPKRTNADLTNHGNCTPSDIDWDYLKNQGSE